MMTLQTSSERNHSFGYRTARQFAADRLLPQLLANLALIVIVIIVLLLSQETPEVGLAP